MIKKSIFLLIIYFFILPVDVLTSDLEKELKKLDNEFSGNLGVYIKLLEDNTTINYNADRRWYLASTVKIPIAIAILQKVEAGEISLDDKLTLNQTDLVDGAGALVWKEPGTSYTVRELLIRMMRDSDSVAADMLIRLMGEDNFNEHIQEHIISDGIERITTILQVRYEAYGELHEKAASLSNMDIIRLKGVTPLQERLNEFVRMIDVDKSELKVNSIPEAFEKYYESKLNTGKLVSMGLMLERLVEGKYLNDEHTKFLIDIMKGITTGDYRIKAGLPPGTVFAQKTGTQISRACNMGIIYLPNGEAPIIVAACVEKYNGLSEAETTLKQIGRLITENLLNK